MKPWGFICFLAHCAQCSQLSGRVQNHDDEAIDTTSPTPDKKDVNVKEFMSSDQSLDAPIQEIMNNCIDVGSFEDKGTQVYFSDLLDQRDIFITKECVKDLHEISDNEETRYYNSFHDLMILLGDLNTTHSSALIDRCNEVYARIKPQYLSYVRSKMRYREADHVLKRLEYITKTRDAFRRIKYASESSSIDGKICEYDTVDSFTAPIEKICKLKAAQKKNIENERKMTCFAEIQTRQARKIFELEEKIQEMKNNGFENGDDDDDV